jgi:hypothetical protein
LDDKKTDKREIQRNNNQKIGKNDEREGVSFLKNGFFG